MSRDNNINDLLAFLAVARERSFTRAAAKMGVSQSALSHTVRALEARMGARLLTRTTRSVAPTEMGERLLLNVGPRFEEIEAELAALGDLRDKPAGTVRITAIDYHVNRYIWPRLAPLLREYPELNVEIQTDYRLVDIVAEGFDIGVRHGDQVAKDMIAVPLTEPVPMCIVAAPSYLQEVDDAPRTPQDLADHPCIALRLATRGGLYAWELQKGRRKVQARVNGQVVFNGVYQMIEAALAGVGLAFVPLDLVAPHLASGALVAVMDDWCAPFEPLYLYYPSRRQTSRALQLVVEALRYRRPSA
jgi:DNA-binding transcriptional LysR family regulator